MSLDSIMSEEWRQAVQKWFEAGYILSVLRQTETTVLVELGQHENLGFHFMRDLIPIDGGLHTKFVDKQTCRLEYVSGQDKWGYGHEVFLSLLRIADRHL